MPKPVEFKEPSFRERLIQKKERGYRQYNARYARGYKKARQQRVRRHDRPQGGPYKVRLVTRKEAALFRSLSYIDVPLTDSKRSFLDIFRSSPR
jgi:hypothetical protein